MTSSAHPFLENEIRIKWSQLTAPHIEDDVKQGIAIAKERIEKICNLSDSEISYETTFKQFDKLDEELSVGFGKVSHLQSVAETPEIRAAHTKVLPIVSEFSSSVRLNSKLWAVFKKAQEKCKSEDLTNEEKRYIELTIKDFVENGADLPDDKKKRLTEISVELSNLTTKYQQNVKDSINKGELYIANEEQLKGLPESIVSAAKEDATKKGKPDQWRFSLQDSSQYPLMQFLDDEEIRHQMYKIGLTVGTGEFDNAELVKKICALRDEKAKILGFATFADFVLSQRMAANGANALKFVEELHAKVFKQYNEDVDDVRKFMAKKNAATPLKPWNFAYWCEKQRKELYEFEEEELKPYFPTQNVLDGLFKIVQTLYGIEVRKLPTYKRKENEPEQEGKVEVWNEDVMFFEIYDVETKKLLGVMYADLYPREEKRSGAWMDNLTSGHPSAGIPNLVFLCANLNKPVGDKPALLTHDDVSTIFHEFGHCLHGILYDCEIKSLSGMEVPWDFVELPSQFHENYVWEKDALDLFASHYQTHEKIPEELYKKMIAARNYQSAYVFNRQLYFSRIDFAVHQEYQKWKDMSIEEIDDAVSVEYRIQYNEPVRCVFRSFNHLFSSPVGYAGGYYSYKWAEVLDADCFSRFQKEGIMNPETGKSFRKEILAKGNTIPVQEAFRNFMGRDPSQEALLKRSGIKQ